MTDVRAGDLVRVRARVLSVDPLGAATVELLDGAGRAVPPPIVLPADADTPVVLRPLAVLDIVQHGATGRTAVVRWVSDDGRQWSSQTAAAEVFSARDWTVVGRAELV